MILRGVIDMLQKSSHTYASVFLVGLVGGAIAIAVALALRTFLSAMFIPELASQTLFSLTPGEIESQAVETLGPIAKYSAIIGALIVNLVVYGILSLFDYKIYMKINSGNSYLRAASYLRTAAISSGVDQNRRLLIKGGLASVVVIPLLYLGLNNLLFPRESAQSRLPLESEVASKPRPAGFEDPRLTALLASEITPTDLFYRVDINPVPPTVDVNSWRLVVKGLVSRPLTLTYEQLKARPSVQQIATLECVSNKIANDFISTAIWNGIKLKDLLDEAGVKPNAKYIVFRCADGYDVGIPLERGFQEGSILAHGMNGETLNAKHGYPVRAIIPGLYGMMNPKWITEIELVGEIYEGYWQKKGWANNAQYNTHSFIVIPGNDPVGKVFRNLGALNIVVGEEIPIAGVAFAGDRGISKVEVSSDGGATWKEARIKDPLSPYTWVLWATELNVTTKGNYKIIVRATDKTGKIQTAEVRDPFPNGAMGYHVVNAQASS